MQLERRRPAIVAAVAAVVLVSGGLAAAAGVGPSVWEPLFRLGDGSDLGALRKVDRLLGFAREVALHRELDAAAAELWEEVRDNLTTLDVEEIYEMLEERGTGPDRGREVWFEGRLAPGAYRFSVAKGARTPRRFGDVSGRFAVRPGNPRPTAAGAEVEENDNFVVGWSGKARLDDLRIGHLAGYAAESLRFFSEHTALAGSAPADGRDDADARLLATVREGMPASYGLMTRYLDVRDVVAARGQAPEGARVRVRAAVRMEPFARDYPELAELLDGARGVIDATLRFVDRRGRDLATIEVDSKHLEVAFETYALGDRLVPVTRAGRPVLADAIDLEAVTRDDLTLDVRTYTEITGVWSRLTDLRFDVAYRRDAVRGGWHVSLTEPPRFKAGGAALGVVPLWVLDAMIPSNLEAIATSFFDTLALGNDGRGMWGRFLFPASARGRDVVAEMEGELLSNGFLSFVLRIVAWKIIPDDDARAEVKRLKEGVIDAFAADLGAARRRLEAVAAQQDPVQPAAFRDSPVR